MNRNKIQLISTLEQIHHIVDRKSYREFGPNKQYELICAVAWVEELASIFERKAVFQQNKGQWEIRLDNECSLLIRVGKLFEGNIYKIRRQLDIAVLLRTNRAEFQIPDSGIWKDLTCLRNIANWISVTTFDKIRRLYISMYKKYFGKVESQQEILIAIGECKNYDSNRAYDVRWEVIDQLVGARKAISSIPISKVLFYYPHMYDIVEKAVRYCDENQYVYSRIYTTASITKTDADENISGYLADLQIAPVYDFSKHKK